MSRLDGPRKAGQDPKAGRPAAPEVPRSTDRGFPLLRISEAYHDMDDLVAPDATKERLRHVMAENAHGEMLRSHGLHPKGRILFCGPPGTGKTLTARIMASMMGRPLALVSFDSMVSSYLGETASNLRRIFDYMEGRRLVVFFDEFDVVGKKRDDPQEHGEIKRLVNNFMQMLDCYEGQSVILAATNHQHLLDGAVLRRFDEVILFDLPDGARRRQLFEKCLRVLHREKNIAPVRLARRTGGMSAADITAACQDALKRCLIDGRRTVSQDDVSWAISEQRRRKKAVAGGG